MEVVGGGDLYGQLQDPFGLRKLEEIWLRIAKVKSDYFLKRLQSQTSPAKYNAPEPLVAFEEAFSGEISSISKLLSQWERFRDASLSACTQFLGSLRAFYESDSEEAEENEKQVTALLDR